MCLEEKFCATTSLSKASTAPCPMPNPIEKRMSPSNDALKPIPSNERAVSKALAKATGPTPKRSFRRAAFMEERVDNGIIIKITSPAACSG